jgi:hypothetical protein
VGEYQHGRRRGEGVYTWKEGSYSEYRGQFEDDLMAGRGTLKMRGSHVIEGIFNCDANFAVKDARFSHEGVEYIGSVCFTQGKSIMGNFNPVLL